MQPKRTRRQSASAVLHGAANVAAPTVARLTELTLSNGAKIRAQRVPATVLQQIAMMPKPLPPREYDPQLLRDEPNPFSPIYLAQLKQREETIRDRMFDAMLIFGLKVLYLPPEVEPVESEEWRAGLRMLGIPFDPDQAEILWRRYILLASLGDLANALEAIGRETSVNETDISALVQLFRSEPTRGAD